jgi:hypothetical protein
MVIRVLEEHHSETVFARNVVHILMEAQGETTIWLLKQEMANRYRRELKIEDCQNRLKQYIEVRNFIYQSFLTIFSILVNRSKCSFNTTNAICL